jgi:uncharacterized phiE125 gp8 family phage protein
MFSQCDSDMFIPGRAQLPYNWFAAAGQFFNISRGPVQSITSITTYKQRQYAGSGRPRRYRFDGPGERVVLNDNQNWPTDLRLGSAIYVRYVTGYGADPGDVPGLINQAIIQQVGAMYENRSCADLQPGVIALLIPFQSAAALMPW